MRPVAASAACLVFFVLTFSACSGGDKAADPTLESARRKTACAGQDFAACLAPAPTVRDPSQKCAATDLSGFADFGPDKYNPAPGSIDGAVVLTLNEGAAPCLLSPPDKLSLSVGEAADLPMSVTASSPRDVVIQGTDRNTDGAYLTFVWHNWCGVTTPVRAIVHVVVAGGDGQLDVPVIASSGGTIETKFPPCTDPAEVDVSTVAASFNTIFIIWSTT